jgi:hypothetical protein
MIYMFLLFSLKSFYSILINKCQNIIQYKKLFLIFSFICSDKSPPASPPEINKKDPLEKYIKNIILKRIYYEITKDLIDIRKDMEIANEFFVKKNDVQNDYFNICWTFSKYKNKKIKNKKKDAYFLCKDIKNIIINIDMILLTSQSKNICCEIIFNISKFFITEGYEFDFKECLSLLKDFFQIDNIWKYRMKSLEVLQKDIPFEKSLEILNNIPQSYINDEKIEKIKILFQQKS